MWWILLHETFYCMAASNSCTSKDIAYKYSEIIQQAGKGLTKGLQVKGTKWKKM